MAQPRDGWFEGWRLAPVASEGPELMRDGRGRDVWRFMYASWVFTWPKDSARVSIEHGTLTGSGNWRMPDNWGFDLPFTAWTGLNLANAAKNWQHNHDGRFS